MCAAAKPITAWCSAADPAPPLPSLRSLPSIHADMAICTYVFRAGHRGRSRIATCPPGSWRRRLRLAANPVPAPVRPLPTSWRVDTPPSLLGVSVSPRENARPPLGVLYALGDRRIPDPGRRRRGVPTLFRSSPAHGGEHLPRLPWHPSRPWRASVFLAAPTSAGCGWSGIPRSRSAVHAAERGAPRYPSARPRNGAGS